jgi:predicted O-methyltransferase YrrM
VPEASTIPASSLGKGLQALLHLLRHPAHAARSFGRGLAGIYRESVAGRSPLPAVRLQDLIGRDTEVALRDFHGRDGNVTLQELVAIGALVRHRQPRVLLEIGTFDGNTALQMAANAPPAARVFTLDLPADGGAAGTLDPQDLAYVRDPARQQRKFARSPYAGKVTQWLGDSATFDFAAALGGQRVEFAFIDGSHAHDYVKGDTLRVLSLLAPDGVVLWHDYTPGWPGVVRFLDGLSRTLPLQRIDGTALVYCARDSARDAVLRR